MDKNIYKKAAKVSQFEAHNDRWVNECRELWSVNKFLYKAWILFDCSHLIFSVCQKNYTEICLGYFYYYFGIENKTKNVKLFIVAINK